VLVPAASRSYPLRAHAPSSLSAEQTTPEETAHLLQQLSAIDVPLVNDLFTATMADAAASATTAALEPPSEVVKVSAAAAETRAAWFADGLSAIARGKAAVLVLAGGQGTRLGSDRPKGEYDIGLPSRRSLFQLLAERCRRLVVLAAGLALPDARPSLPVYVMTSPMTDAETREYWLAHDFFGLPKGDVRFFSQGTLPCMDLEGKIMLESGGAVAEAPDGNGGIYRALHLTGTLADMQARGVEGVHVFAVDNAIVKAGDPAFLGFCMGRGADVGSKACPKTGPHEKVGVLCKRGGAYAVVEYSELDKASAEAVDAAGELLYNAGNICIHYYSTDFLAHKCSPASLPKVYHVARKAIPFANPATGRTLSKVEMAGKGVTGVKLESFIFDVFPASRAMAVLEIGRADEFSPVKNAPGSSEDSPDTARDMVVALHAGWLKAAGVGVEGAGLVEVSPLVSYAGEGLQALAGCTIQAPALVQQATEALPGGAGVPSGGEAVAQGVRRVQQGALSVYLLE
jgi:UDP-N-acetylglucosamine/UDP-N-acetylgalactosamine diphosphorylase